MSCTYISGFSVFPLVLLLLLWDNHQSLVENSWNSSAVGRVCLLRLSLDVEFPCFIFYFLDEKERRKTKKRIFQERGMNVIIIIIGDYRSTFYSTTRVSLTGWSSYNANSRISNVGGMTGFLLFFTSGFYFVFFKSHHVVYYIYTACDTMGSLVTGCY